MMARGISLDNSAVFALPPITAAAFDRSVSFSPDLVRYDLK